MPKRVLVPLAEGFEEAEFIGIADVLKRAGLQVIIASLNGDNLVKGANGIVVQAEIALQDVALESLDAICLAGGFDGMQNLSNNEKILYIIKELYRSGKLVAAICASPIVLSKAGVISGDFTCYPGCEVGIAGNRLNKAVVVNKNVITSAGPATAILFGLEVAKYLCGNETYQSLYEGLQTPLATA